MYRYPHFAESGADRRSLSADAAKGKPDKPVALRFISRKGGWVYEIHGIEGRVDPSLGKRLKADGDGWIVPSAAAPGTLA